MKYILKNVPTCFYNYVHFNISYETAYSKMKYAKNVYRTLLTDSLP